TRGSFFWPNALSQATWSYPRTNRLLMEAGVTVAINARNVLRQGGASPTDIPITELSTGLKYGARAAKPDTIGISDYGPTSATQNNLRFATSYITGSHAFKVGFSNYNGFPVANSALNETAYGPVAFTFRNQVPTAVTYYASPL